MQPRYFLRVSFGPCRSLRLHIGCTFSLPLTGEVALTTFLPSPEVVETTAPAGLANSLVVGQHLGQVRPTAAWPHAAWRTSEPRARYSGGACSPTSRSSPRRSGKRPATRGAARAG